jgi:hypothetical protein
LQGLWGIGEHLRLLDVGCPKSRMEVGRASFTL